MRSFSILCRQKEGVKFDNYEITVVGRAIDKKVGECFVLNQFKVDGLKTAEFVRLTVSINRTLQVWLDDDRCCYVRIVKSPKGEEMRYTWHIDAPACGVKVYSLDKFRRIKLHLTSDQKEESHKKEKGAEEKSGVNTGHARH